MRHVINMVTAVMVPESDARTIFLCECHCLAGTNENCRDIDSRSRTQNGKCRVVSVVLCCAVRLPFFVSFSCL